MTARPRALIFDMDGLLVDTEPMYWDVGRELARRHGNKTLVDDTLRRMMGRSRLDSTRILIDDAGITGFTTEALLALREELMLERYARGVEPMPGVREILNRFHGRMKLAVATSSPKHFTDVLLPAIGAARYFDVVQMGDEIVNGKPDPEIYLKCMAQLGLPAAECVVLEDSTAGSLAGHRAGARVIAVPSHLTAEQDFSFADFRASDLHAAAAIIESMMTSEESR